MVLKAPIQGQVPTQLVEALLRRLSRPEFAGGAIPKAFRLDMKELLKAYGYYNISEEEWQEILEAMNAHEYGTVVCGDGRIMLAGDPPPFDDGSENEKPFAA